MTSRLEKKYKEEVIPKIKERFGIKSAMAVPRLEKIVINMGVGRAVGDIKVLENAVDELTTISGQRPMTTRSKKAISNFKLKENIPIGCKVTLRRLKMFEFMDRLVNVALPRIRDFNGVSKKSFDQQGNYTLGIQDQAIFPEIDTGKMKYTHGMDITFVFDKGKQEQIYEVLSLLGMPFTRDKK